MHLIDLAYHQRCFENNESFSYVIFDNEPEQNYLGCIYIYPMGFRTDITDENCDFDADISFWITEKFYTPEFYAKISNSIQTQLKQAFPFFNFYNSNKIQ